MFLRISRQGSWLEKWWSILIIYELISKVEKFYFWIFLNRLKNGNIIFVWRCADCQCWWNECWWKTQCIDMILTAFTRHRRVSVLDNRKEKFWIGESFAKFSRGIWKYFIKNLLLLKLSLYLRPVWLWLLGLGTKYLVSSRTSQTKTEFDN